MDKNCLYSISPIDGRYLAITLPLQAFFSEFALNKYRLQVEIAYFDALCHAGLPELQKVRKDLLKNLKSIGENFSDTDARRMKEFEGITNHDIKALEYFLREEFARLGMPDSKEFVHFGLTSQDINNTAIPLMLRLALEQVMYPAIESLLGKLHSMARDWKNIPMLARTHGQPASPTTLGKELLVFHQRLNVQFEHLKNIPIPAKFGGATGNFNAHHVAYPEIDWNTFADRFVEGFGLQRSCPTTQIEHYDNLAAIFDNLKRLCTILIDLDRDFWSYMSMDYFRLRVKKNEVGSSAMPHKVNPIDFENAEGNAGIAIALFEHFSAKLPVSRLQRDLTDSTVLRNIGVPLGHMLIAVTKTIHGLNKVLPNQDAIESDLKRNYAVVAEAIQTILRKISYPDPYEKLKDLTRTQNTITKETIDLFIDSLNVSEEMKRALKEISPENYTGIQPDYL